MDGSVHRSRHHGKAFHSPPPLPLYGMQPCRYDQSMHSCYLNDIVQNCETANRDGIFFYIYSFLKPYTHAHTHTHTSSAGWHLDITFRHVSIKVMLPDGSSVRYFCSLHIVARARCVDLHRTSIFSTSRQRTPSTLIDTDQTATAGRVPCIKQV